MLRELAAAAQRWEEQDVLSPVAFARKSVTWIIDLERGKDPVAVGPHRRGEHTLQAPARQRSGAIASNNLKPYLLIDDARYALGIPDPGRDRDAALAHHSFVRLVSSCASVVETDESRHALSLVSDFLLTGAAERLDASIRPRDIVAFRVGTVFPTDRDDVREFWRRHLEKELTGPEAWCAICGIWRPSLRILPVPVTLFGQACQISSFNLSAFWSHGKEQMANAPVCYACVSTATQALNYLTSSDQHRAILSIAKTASTSVSPLRNQMAVFWLRERPNPIELDGSSIEIDTEALASAVLQSLAGPQDGPEPGDAQLEALLKSPWTGREEALNIRNNAFHLALLSPNKARLAIREWIVESLENVLANLRAYLTATAIVEPNGARVRAVSLSAIIDALRINQGSGSEAGLIRPLLRTAYLGQPPPQSLLHRALSEFRLPSPPAKTSPERIAAYRRKHRLAAAIKLAISYGKDQAESMQTLTLDQASAGSLCGRLLAIAEESQRRSLPPRQRLDTTLAERSYGGASTAPASVLPTLLRLVKSAYLPKIRRQRGRAREIETMLQEVFVALGREGGMPARLTPEGQAEFALGFYLQQATFAKEQSERLIGTMGRGDSQA